jgi:TldD protein
MTKELVKPEKFFTEKFGITSQQLEKIMGQSLGQPLDDADLYFEYRVNDSVSLEERLVKKALRQVSQGVGVRAIAGEKTDMPIRMR